MNYRFKDKNDRSETLLTLTVYSIKVEKGDKHVVVPFASISHVKMGRENGYYYLLLSGEGFTPLRIPSRAFNGQARVDQGRAYSTFVRVLHYHLREKSKAQYAIGMNMNQSIFAAFIFLVSGLASFFIAREGYINIEPFIAGILAAFGITSLFIFLNKGHLPRPYSPDFIPEHLLPSESNQAAGLEKNQLII
ncbi:MAG: hypothetical protein L0Y35_08060 [Flammeovirgaceae bacterium]|nr:hypothetical protein [Flammeovirgaceae bacterium]